MILNRSRMQQSRRSAFTLLEILVVVAIIVVLASAGSIAYMSYLDEAKIKTSIAKAHNIATAAKSYYLNNGGSTDGLTLQALIAPPRPLLEGGTDAIVTPWGTPFNLDMGAETGTSNQNIMVTFQTPDGQVYDDRGKRRK